MRPFTGRTRTMTMPRISSAPQGSEWTQRREHGSRTCLRRRRVPGSLREEPGVRPTRTSTVPALTSSRRRSARPSSSCTAPRECTRPRCRGTATGCGPRWRPTARRAGQTPRPRGLWRSAWRRAQRRPRREGRRCRSGRRRVGGSGRPRWPRCGRRRDTVPTQSRAVGVAAGPRTRAGPLDDVAGTRRKAPVPRVAATGSMPHWPCADRRRTVGVVELVARREGGDGQDPDREKPSRVLPATSTVGGQARVQQRRSAPTRRRWLGTRSSVAFLDVELDGRHEEVQAASRRGATASRTVPGLATGGPESVDDDEDAEADPERRPGTGR